MAGKPAGKGREASVQFGAAVAPNQPLLSGVVRYHVGGEVSKVVQVSVR
jgi:hypothetical protein